jgi:hypothetical protein
LRNVLPSANSPDEPPNGRVCSSRRLVAAARSRALRGAWARRASFVAAVSLFGCSRDARSVRLPAYSPSDEIYRINCEGSINACRAEAADACGGRYEVLESSGASVEPERVTSAPGPASTGPRYQRKKWLGQLVVACGNVPAPEAVTTQPAAHEVRHSAPVAPEPDRLCVPGATQECLGPGACRGAQACLTDGEGYGPCDCGSARTHAQSGDARFPRDGAAPVPTRSD